MIKNRVFNILGGRKHWPPEYSNFQLPVQVESENIVPHKMYGPYCNICLQHEYREPS